MKKMLFLVALVLVASMLVPAAPAAAQGCSYTVKAGDTSSAIAAAEGITLGQLVAANPGLNTRWIGIGQTLNICPNVVPTVGTTSFTADLGPSPARQTYRGVNAWVEANCVAYHMYLDTTVCIEWSTGSVVIPYRR